MLRVLCFPLAEETCFPRSHGPTSCERAAILCDQVLKTSCLTKSNLISGQHEQEDPCRLPHAHLHQAACVAAAVADGESTHPHQLNRWIRKTRYSSAGGLRWTHCRCSVLGCGQQGVLHEPSLDRCQHRLAGESVVGLSGCFSSRTFSRGVQCRSGAVLS